MKTSAFQGFIENLNTNFMCYHKRIPRGLILAAPVDKMYSLLGSWIQMLMPVLLKKIYKFRGKFVS